MQIITERHKPPFEIVPAGENIQDEVNKRTCAAGYTDRDGQPKDRPRIRSFGGLGKNRISIWPRDEQGNLIGD